MQTTEYPLLAREVPPVCIHALGQGLVDNLWQQGRDLFRYISNIPKLEIVSPIECGTVLTEGHLMVKWTDDEGKQKIGQIHKDLLIYWPSVN